MSRFISKQYGFFSQETSTYFVTWNCGFFSILSTCLLNLAKLNGECNNINATLGFSLFKDDPRQDCWYIFFKASPKHTERLLHEESQFRHVLLHHSRYERLNFVEASLMIQRYFQPSDQIIEIANSLKKKYQIEPNNTCCIYYRGTDKHTEIESVSPDIYLEKTKRMIADEPGLRVLIQTDQEQIRQYLHHELGDRSFYFHELSTTSGDEGFHFCIQDEKLMFAKTFLAVQLIMAQSRFLITGTTNVAYWTVLFRGNCENVIQI